MAAASGLFSAISSYVEGVARLLQLDATLLTLETRQNLQSVAVAAAILVGAAAMGFLGVVILLIAIVLLLIQLGLAPSLAALAVAVALFVIAAGLYFAAMGRLKGWSLVPQRTLTQVKQNIETLRASLRHEPNPNVR